MIFTICSTSIPPGIICRLFDYEIPRESDDQTHRVGEPINDLRREISERNDEVAAMMSSTIFLEEANAKQDPLV